MTEGKAERVQEREQAWCGRGAALRPGPTGCGEPVGNVHGGGLP